MPLYNATMRCVLIGNYGVGNFGDEAIREYFETRFNTVEWFVLSANPTGTQLPRLPFGIRSFTRNWLKTLRAYYKADVIMYGGGTLFTDIESVEACLLWWWHAVPARLLRKKIILVSQGIGPFKTTLGKALAKSICKRAVFISVRDELSLQRMQDWSLKTTPLLTVDPVVLCVQKLDTSANISNRIGIIPRHNSNEHFLQLAKQFITDYKTSTVCIISFHPSSHSEQKVIEQLQRIAPQATVHPITTMEDAITTISNCKTILSHRFHGSLISRCLGVTVITGTQSTNDKHSSLQQSLANMPAAKQQALAAEKALAEYLR